MSGETCRTCKFWRGLAAADAAERIPRRWHLAEPGECRLRPAPAFNPQFGLETFPVLGGGDEGCSEHSGRAGGGRRRHA